MILVPQFGLFFWSLVIFLTVFFLLKKFAWKPILSGLKEREESITSSLQQAEKARQEMAKLTGDNQRLLTEARQEREAMLQEAAKYRDELIEKARTEAATAAAKEMEKAKAQIETEKNAALVSIKNEAGMMAVTIAEKILRKELSDRDNKIAFAQQLVSELNKN
jgi:F-type H+-transporting ATPase subunit b